MTKQDNNSQKQSLGMLEQILQKNGIRMTHQRIEIFQELIQSKQHPSAENIYEQVVKRLPTISLDTVYRTIATFEELGIVKRVEILDDCARYDANLEPHHHLICIRCKRIEDFTWPGFENLTGPTISNWGEISSRHAEIRGICQKCSTG